MKTEKTENQKNATRGFTLIEMVGVLAVIAVLAALLIPRIFAAISESRLNNAVVSVNTVKSAGMMYFGKYGKFAGLNGAPINTPTNWDKGVLLPEGLIEKPFAVRVGTNALVMLAAPSTVAVDAATNGYCLSGNMTLTNETVSCQYVLECVIQGVPYQDALDINKRIDGSDVSLGEGNGGTPGSKDVQGRVKYNIASGLGDVHIYIAHK